MADSGSTLDALFAQAYALHQQGRLTEARSAYEQVLRDDPGHFRSLHLLGIVAAQSNRLQEAEAFIGRAIALKPDDRVALCDHARVLHGLGWHAAALDSLERLIRLHPDDGDGHTLRGIELAEAGRHDEALQSLSRAVEIAPNRPDYHNNHANMLRLRGQLDASRQSLERALSLAPDFADAWFNLGLVLSQLGLHSAAISSYDRLVLLVPGHAGAHQNRGVAQRELGEFDAALASLTKAAELNPRSPDIHRSLGLVHFDLRHFPEALAQFDAAIALHPGHAEAWYGRANSLVELARYDESVASYGQALSLNPDYRFVRGLRLHAKLLAAQWADLDSDIQDLERRAARLEPVAPPFHALPFMGSAALQRRLAEVWVNEECPADPSLGPIPPRRPSGRIRIGYFSADFHNHATMELLVEVLGLHDRSRFEVIAFSFGPPSNSPERARLGRACDRVIDVRARSDREISALARSLEIDIAVDLKGFTLDSRPGIFALRAAPLQVNYLGFPGTLGAPYMDYLIADRTLIPETERPHYAEKIVYLPECYQPNDSMRRIADTLYTRDALGLPDPGFVFCCFNAHYKILPAVFDSWMRILRCVDGSVLWLLGNNPDAARNLRREAELRGIDGNRLVFAPTLPLAEHLARHRCADLFLDTVPCNAHTTASDALWAGLPLLTCRGRTFAGRVAASLLGAIRLPELITEDLGAYERRAVELAKQPLLLGHIRRRLHARRQTAPLFDSPRYTADLEYAYARMIERARTGQAPEDIYLPGQGNRGVPQPNPSA